MDMVGVTSIKLVNQTKIKVVENKLRWWLLLNARYKWIIFKLELD